MFKVLEEKQLTHDLTYNHDLDNNDNFSPDGKWLVYDTRTDEGGIPESARIEKVCIETGEIKTIYQIQNNGSWGPGAGAVSYSPVEDAVVFIHGLPDCTPENPYQQWRRTGVIVREIEPGKPIFMDARDINPPFSPGALRGGTHRHEWSGDGKWIGFTYNDAILKAVEDTTGTKRNLRTIGVSKNIGIVQVNESAENISGEWFSVLVVRVVPNPIPGSDEVNHAANDSWIGKNGYLKPDGNWQMARAFLGTVVDNEGNAVPEVFVVDIPDDITTPGEFGPLEGTNDGFPMPPAGTVQRRLTLTADSPFPGCNGIVRSSPDGSLLAFIARDTNGINQIFTISPLGGEPKQLTWHDSDVTANLRWHPRGESVTYVWKGSIVNCEVGNSEFLERIQILTKPSEQAPTNLVWSHDGKVLAFNKLVEHLNTGLGSRQVFVLEVDI